MNSPLHVESALIRAASLLLGRAAAAGLTVRVLGAKRELAIVADADDVARAAEPPPVIDGTGWLQASFFSDEEAAIVRVLADGELAAAGIASRIGSELTTRLRVILANLADRGVLLSGTAGYRVADARLLSLADARQRHANGG